MQRKIVKAILYFFVLIVYRVQKIGEKNLPKDREIYYMCKPCTCNGFNMFSGKLKKKYNNDCKRRII